MSTRPDTNDNPDLFGGLSPEELREVERVTLTRSFRRGQVIYTPGETGEALFLLREGAVQIYRMSPEGRKLVIAHLLPFSFFGEMSCIGQGMYDTFAEVTEDSTIVTMNCEVLNRLLINKPEIARRILESFGRRVLEAERQLEETVFKGIPARVAALLLREANGDAVDGLTHQDIAERLGVYRETATNALNELKAASLIAIGRKHISILDRERLARIAGG
ncbi:MAG: family transcriptional regulator, cyclic receptor protein [Acidobacteriota bacterium]|jgi:CRP-like cAMP-binding protein|nr:family transcriptional regulator, cyclic receptor protein [Acidobacteriota bacterium]